MARRTEMTDREKMIDLIINAKKTNPETGSFTEYLADFLLGYGVKLPTSNPQPCKPLTLEQLREMDGKPAWIVPVNDKDWEPHWAVGFWHDRDESLTFWCAYTDDGFYTDCDAMPTHWMPLPEPPEEG